ncbi:MAG TPA: DsrE/DsrF/DrsH-like family protein [Actinomycetota bacterium]|nr:DsrE/DsrF/DrsH-like family protein [Actinomycetota bacterium]
MLQETDVAVGTQVTEEDVRRIVREEVERAFKKDPGKNCAAIIASKGTLDWSYPPLILATTAGALGMETSVFFTFYGLSIIHKEHNKLLRIGAVGNPAMPMPVPMPQLVAALPGMVPLATAMMKSKFKKKNVATIDDLLEAALESDVKLIACQMTMEVFGYAESDFVDGVQFGGAAAFMSHARKAHTTLFM